MYSKLALFVLVPCQQTFAINFRSDLSPHEAVRSDGYHDFHIGAKHGILHGSRDVLSAVQRVLSGANSLSGKRTSRDARGAHRDILPDSSSSTNGINARPVDQSPASCSLLRNRGTHFTVDVKVGTPGPGMPDQSFELVADTGSDSVVVAACECMANKRCDARNRCFSSMPQASTSLRIKNVDKSFPSVLMTFGSGQIQALIASDYVTVGNVRSFMPDGVMLMVDQALRMSGPFEGILGLGLPREGGSAVMLSNDRSKQAAMLPQTGLNQQGFLQESGISRFSMCFNTGRDGVLRIGTPKHPAAMGSIGTMHWALSMHGISVGNEVADTHVCTHKSLGAETACGAIPDSGTTVMMAPPAQLKALFDDICMKWPRCEMARLSSTGRQPHEVFENLLYSCAEWMDKEKGPNLELPDMHFKVSGREGQVQTVTLKPQHYILEIMESEMHYVIKHQLGLFPSRVAEPTGRKTPVCTPAFGTHDYTTENNGPIWVLGTPFFYAYQVGYDLSSKPPSVSFSPEPCGRCEGAKTSFMLKRNEFGEIEESWPPNGEYRGLRRIHNALRMPSFNTSTPL